MLPAVSTAYRERHPRRDGTGGGQPVTATPGRAVARYLPGLLVVVLVSGTELGAAEGLNPVPTGYQFKTGQRVPADWRGRDSAGVTIVNPRDGAELCWVPPGEFTMGSGAREQEWALAGGALPSWVTTEGPQHRVRLTGFWLYRCEVTNAQFRKFRPTHDSGIYDGVDVNGDARPVVQITWGDAADYCRWAEVELPTEAQWEYACRGGATTMFPWGDDPLLVARYANIADRRAKRQWPDWTCVEVDDGYVASAPVGAYQANAFGLCDMIGNVWEWCADWFEGEYYAHSPATDPTGPREGTERVVRGASWDNWMANARAAYRLHYPPTEAAAYLGFRAMKPAAVPVGIE